MNDLLTGRYLRDQYMHVQILNSARQEQRYDAPAQRSMGNYAARGFLMGGKRKLIFR